MIRIPKTIYEEMIAHARARHPYECCGLLAGKAGEVGRHYRITNILAAEPADMANFDAAKAAQLNRMSPDERARVAFVMDAREMSSALKEMRANHLELQVIYHSHPNGPDGPSLTDIKIATDFESTREALHLPEPLYVIISMERPDGPVVKGYRIVEQNVLEEKLGIGPA